MVETHMWPCSNQFAYMVSMTNSGRGTAIRPAPKSKCKRCGEASQCNCTSHTWPELSGGEQQRVAVARALMNKPAIVFADEPSGNLDSQSSKELHQLLFQLRDDFQQTFVIVTHNTALAEMSDRTLVIEDGLII